MPVDVIRHPTANRRARLDARRLARLRATAGADRLVSAEHAGDLPSAAGSGGPPLPAADRRLDGRALGGRCRPALAGPRRPAGVPRRANAAPGNRTRPYDRLLASAVVLAEFFDASANNLVVEMPGPRHAAAVQPPPGRHRTPGGPTTRLYFDRIEEVPELLAPQRVAAAHEHLLGARPDPLHRGRVRRRGRQHSPQGGAVTAADRGSLRSTRAAALFRTTACTTTVNGSRCDRRSCGTR